MEPLHTLTQGDTGPRLVFLHGLFGQGRNWTTIGKRFADDHRVIMVDLPNHGRSPWTDDVSFGAMAEHVAATLGEEPAVVVGHSLGGKVAMRLALDHPDLVQRLVVVDIAPVSYAGLSQFGQYVQAMRGIDLDHLDSRGAADEQMAQSVPKDSVRGFLLQNLRREGQGWRWQMNLSVLGDQLDRVADWEPVDTRYEGDTLWVAGADSDYVGAEDGAVMRELFPATRMVRVKGASHWVHADQPDIFTGVLRHFLDQS
ncbi:alpha/beta fold hydrolase [Propionibacteriaceae bacterium Y1700]|uniref:alpha/beta fold hydrolase n=1 Tax=Microlunatus sp. Y1700 TaxID=3418487 RepID=UPI003DA76835